MQSFLLLSNFLDYVEFYGPELIRPSSDYTLPSSFIVILFDIFMLEPHLCLSASVV